MIYELRTYDVKPEHLAAYLRLWDEHGLTVRGGGLYGQLIGFWVSDGGALNQVIHLWAYESAAERTRLRTALMKDARWTHDFLPRALPMLDRMQSSMLQPTSFSPLV